MRRRNLIAAILEGPAPARLLPWTRRHLMQAVFVYNLQGSTPTVIGAVATDELEFAGGTFGSKIAVGAWNDSTHVRTLPSTDKSSANTPNNVKFISQTGGGGGDSQGDWGAGTEDIDAILQAECTLDVDFSDAASVITENHIMYAYDKTTTTTGPVDVTTKMAELADILWSSPDGSAAALAIADDGAATDHNYYILFSASPDTVGLKQLFRFRNELTYS